MYVFSSRKKFLVADILLYEKQLKTENRPQTPPGPLFAQLNKNHQLLGQ